MKTLILILISLFFVACSHGGKHHHADMKAKMMAKKAERMAKKWKMMDANSDGVVDRKEYDAGGEKKWKKLDANSDGKITADEHANYVKNKKKKCSHCK